jgi:hypothetical protein
MLGQVLAAQKRREQRSQQKERASQVQHNTPEPSRPAKKPRHTKAPSTLPPQESLAPPPSLEYMVSSVSSPEVPLARSEYVHWRAIDVQYEDQVSPTKIQIMKDRRSRHARRKHAQADRWNRDVLPSLIRPFMQVTRERFSRSSANTPSPPITCKCGGKSRTLVVLCVSMERLENVTVEVCPCHVAGTQLIERGFFPCAPLYPTLAVSLDMLEFVASLFLNLAPNERAWAATVVGYLKARGYEFATGDSFRRRFANALRYYQVLVRLVRAEITRIVEEDKAGMASQLDEKTPINERKYLTVQIDPMLFPNAAPTSTSRPSPYLRSRCPLCFGGNYTDSSDMP